MLFTARESLFDRQNTWGARNPFTRWVTRTAPATLTIQSSRLRPGVYAGAIYAT